MRALKGMDEVKLVNKLQTVRLQSAAWKKMRQQRWRKTCWFELVDRRTKRTFM